MRRPRGLRPDDLDIWHRVVQTVTPMHLRPAYLIPARPVVAPDPPPTPANPRPPPRIDPFLIGEKASRDHVAMRPQSSGPLMDAKAFARMSRGKLSPESRLDLHGMTLAEAHPELTRFVIAAHAKGQRLVLVITGKGKRGPGGSLGPERPGILKHQVPHWLAMAPLAPLILQVADAHLKHGGGGALYVYLRRLR